MREKVWIDKQLFFVDEVQKAYVNAHVPWYTIPFRNVKKERFDNPEDFVSRE